MDSILYKSPVLNPFPYLPKICLGIPWPSLNEIGDLPFTLSSSKMGSTVPQCRGDRDRDQITPITDQITQPSSQVSSGRISREIPIEVDYPTYPDTTPMPHHNGLYPSQTPDRQRGRRGTPQQQQWTPTANGGSQPRQTGRFARYELLRVHLMGRVQQQ